MTPDSWGFFTFLVALAHGMAPPDFQTFLQPCYSSAPCIELVDAIIICNTFTSGILSSFGILFHLFKYSIVKDSNADSGVIFKFLQNLPISKAVCTKISKIKFLHIFQYFDISERK